MKNWIILNLILFASNLINAQEGNKLEFVNSGKIMLNGKQLTTEELRDEFSSQPAALNLFNKGKSNRTIGTVLLSLGAGLAVGTGIYNLSQSGDENVNCSGTNPPVCEDDSDGGPAGIIIGGAAMLGSIPFLTSGKKKLRESVDLYNESSAVSYENSKGLYITSSQNGVGLSFRF